MEIKTSINWFSEDNCTSETFPLYYTPVIYKVMTSQSIWRVLKVIGCGVTAIRFVQLIDILWKSYILVSHSTKWSLPELNALSRLPSSLWIFIGRMKSELSTYGSMLAQMMVFLLSWHNKRSKCLWESLRTFMARECLYSRMRFTSVSSMGDGFKTACADIWCNFSEFIKNSQKSNQIRPAVSSFEHCGCGYRF